MVVVVVNVLDPETDVVPVAEAAYEISGDVWTLPDQHVRNVVVRINAGGAATPAAGNYTLDADAGTITRLATGALQSTATIRVEYDRIQDERTEIRIDVVREEHTFSAGATGTINLGHANVTNVSVHSTESGGTEYTAGTNYTLDAAAGTLANIATVAPADGATVYVTYSYTESRGVDDTDVIGGAQSDGSLTGISALIGAESIVGHAPKILVAPARSDTQAVANALISAADRLRAVAVVDGPSTTDAEATAYRGNFGSRRAFLVDPGVKVAGAGDETVDRPASAYVAGVIARSDAERGFWWSPSNRLIRGIVGTSREIDFTLGDPAARANLLNEDEIATIIRQTGYRLWGNRTCSADAKWAFLSVVRIADALNDSLLRAHLWAVDRNITRTYLEDVADGVNAYIAELVGLGALLGGRCYPTPDLNTAQTVAAGKVYFDFDFNPVYPAERIMFRSRLVNDYIEEALFS